MKISCPNPSRGFSLVEVIIAVFLTGLIVLVVANIPQAVRLITGSKGESKVREVVAQKIEDVRLSGYDSLDSETGPVTFTDPKLDSLNSVNGAVLVEECPEDVCTHDELIKKVTVTITWTENTEPKRFSVATFVAKGGLK